MSTHALLATLLLAPLPAPPAPADDGGALAPVVQGELGARLDAYVQRLADLGFSGGVVVARRGELLLCKGYGAADRAAGVAAGRGTEFPLGSITKHFTAAAVLRLRADGRLGLEDTLTDWFEDVPQEKRGITIHQLLCHSSGLAESAISIAAAASREEFVRLALSTELGFAPGKGTSYSNLGYGVLAAIVELASGRGFEAYLREALFLPLGMDRTGIDQAAWSPDAPAHGYVDDRDAGTLADQVGGVPGWGLLGSGGLQSTLEDMVRWNQGLDEGTVLDRDTVTLMTTPHARLGPDFAMGYGCGISRGASGHLMVGHNGSNDIFSADFRRYPDDGIVIFAAGNDADHYCFDFTPDLERLVFGEDVPLPPAVVQLGPERLAACAGEWAFEDGGRATVRAERGRLVLSSGDVLPSALLNPVARGQVARRGALLEEAAVAYEAAFEGDLRPLHRLVDAQVPFETFAGRTEPMIEGVLERGGALEAVHTVSGRNRFGEIAVVVVLELERGREMIEYSFGDRGVGSIRGLDELPARVVQPQDPEHFVAYDARSHATWTVRFELDEAGSPAALVLVDEAGREHRGTRG